MFPLFHITSLDTQGKHFKGIYNFTTLNIVGLVDFFSQGERYHDCSKCDKQSLITGEKTNCETQKTFFLATDYEEHLSSEKH